MAAGDQTAGGRSLQSADYRALRQATGTHREELVVRLAGEVGLRPAEITAIRPRHVRSVSVDGATHYLLAVPTRSGEDTEQPIDRQAYLPAEVEHDLRQYVQTADIATDERVLPVTPRRIQMLVSAVGDRAADRTGRATVSDVSSQTLRQYFARHLLADAGVSPTVVRAVGGWESLASLDQYLDSPDVSEIVAAFERSAAVDSPQSGDGADTSALGGGRLTDVLDRLVAVGETLESASTRAEIEERVCETLAADDAYRFAWLAERTGEEFHPRSHAGLDRSRVESMCSADGATEAAHRSGEVQTTADVATDPSFEGWQSDASEHGYDVAIAVPVTAGETRYGVLHLAADSDRMAPGGETVLSGTERRLLADLGRRLGSALAAAERRKLLLADTVVELTFRASAPDSFFATASAQFDCRLELEGVVPGEEGSLLYFVTLSGAEPEDVLGWARDREAVGDVRLIRDHGDQSLVEIVLTAGDVSTALVDRGATVRELTAEDGSQRVVSAVPAGTDVRAFVSGLTEAMPGTELLTKREREQAAETATAFRSSLQESLTEKQSAVLQAAYHADYFEWPRGSTAEELADAIGITSPTLHNHLRRAQQKLLESFYEDAEQHPGTVTPWDEP